MPLKWKIFLALNFTLSLPAFILLVYLVANYSNTDRSREDYLIFGIFAFSLSVMAVNGFLNIFLLQRFFPDKLVRPVFKRLHLLLIILTGIIAAGMLMVCIYGTWEMRDPGIKHEARGWIVLGIFFVTLILQVITLIMQVQLPRLIARNNRKTIHTLIDSIGQ